VDGTFRASACGMVVVAAGIVVIVGGGRVIGTGTVVVEMRGAVVTGTRSALHTSAFNLGPALGSTATMAERFRWRLS